MLENGKKFIRRLTTILRDIPHPVNGTNGMEDILFLTPQGAYNDRAPEVDDYIGRYKDKSARAIDFSYNTDAAATVAKTGIKKGIVDLVHRLLTSNVWQTHLVESTGDNK